MNLQFLATDASINNTIAILIVIFVPLLLTIIVTKWKGFLTGLFFFPMVWSILSFTQDKFNLSESLEKDSSALIKTIGIVLKQGTEIYSNFHYGLINWIVELLKIKEGVLYNILVSPYLSFVPLVVIFILCFIFSGIGRRPKKAKNSQ